LSTATTALNVLSHMTQLKARHFKTNDPSTDRLYTANTGLNILLKSHDTT